MSENISGFRSVSGEAARVPIIPHAYDRWSERTPAEVSLEAAWEAAVSVEAPEADATEARLYPPYNALLVVRDGKLRTVLHNDGRIECSGLGTCDACGKLIDPLAGATCPWCGGETSSERTLGRVTLTRRGM